MWDKRAKVRSAVLTLVKDSNPQDEVFVVNFNHRAYFGLPRGKDFTSDIGEMEAALARIDSNGVTAMRDAICKSVAHLEEKAHKDKKVLVVVTDGNDNSSLVTLKAAVKAAQQSGVVIYSVGLLAEGDPWEASLAKRALNALAKATGGESYFPKGVSAVERVAHKIAYDIRNQYSIVYTPSNQLMDGTFRRIKVTVNGPTRNPIVRTRSGYFATPDQPILRAASYK
jgi:VWFA-related protein